MKSYIVAMAIVVPITLGQEDLDRISYSKAQIKQLIRKEAKRMGVNVRLALAIAEVESQFRPSVINEGDGSGGSFGLFQVWLPTARHLGFKGHPLKLTDPNVNIPLGLMHLKTCESKYEGVKAIACCHNAGFYREDSLCEQGEVKAYVEKVRVAYERH